MSALDRALQVKDLDMVDPTQIVAIGYCLGGSGIIQLHRSYPNGTEGVLGKSSHIVGHAAAPVQVHQPEMTLNAAAT